MSNFEIEVGKIYSNGVIESPKYMERKVIEIYDGKVRYMHAKWYTCKGDYTPYEENEVRVIMLSSFKRWAKEEVIRTDFCWDYK